MTVIAFPLLLISWQFLRSFKAQVDELSDDKKKQEEQKEQPPVNMIAITEEQARQMNLQPMTKEQYEEWMRAQMKEENDG